MAGDYPRFRDALIPHKDYQGESISGEEGEFLWTLIRENDFRKTIETGCALGISSLYICDALSQSRDPSHTIIDPNQTHEYSGIGMCNLQAHGINFFSLIEEPSELALPKLVERNEIFDLGFIDSWHTFDHALLDFFYLNRLVRVGGMIVFHDAIYPSISKLLRYLSKYPAYKIVLPRRKSLKPARLTFRQQLFYMLILVTGWIPERARRAVFSERVISGDIQARSPSNIVGLKKVADDMRNYDWYEPF
jgi:predicted O-methyltransferase YrrM